MAAVSGSHRAAATAPMIARSASTTQSRDGIRGRVAQPSMFDDPHPPCSVG
jgi:hypothetical protein